jgi:hypothetical protein
VGDCAALFDSSPIADGLAEPPRAKKSSRLIVTGDATTEMLVELRCRGFARVFSTKTCGLPTSPPNKRSSRPAPPRRQGACSSPPCNRRANGPSLFTRHCRPSRPVIDCARYFLPVRFCVDLVAPSAALGAHDTVLEVGDFRLWRIAPDFDDGLVPARVVQAIRDQAANAVGAAWWRGMIRSRIGDESMHALPAHVCEVHRRAGFVFALDHRSARQR